MWNEGDYRPSTRLALFSHLGYEPPGVDLGMVLLSVLSSSSWFSSLLVTLLRVKNKWPQDHGITGESDYDPARHPVPLNHEPTWIH